MSFNIQNHIELTQVETRQDSSLGIMRWGRNNSFPETFKNLVAQSPSAKPAVERTAMFYKGAGFDGEDEVVSPDGLTLGDVVSILADDLSLYEAFSLHTNYNIKGLVGSIQPMRISTLRLKEFDELNFASKIGYHPDFARNSVVKKTVDTAATKSNIKWFDRFNPDPEVVAKQVDLAGSLSDYNGQILYVSNTGFSSYPVPKLQAPINFVLSDIENSILVRKESTTGFISSYLLKTTLASEDPNLAALEVALEEAQGARGTGKIVTFANMSPDDIKESVLEEIGTGAAGTKGVMESSTLAYNLANRVINGAYLIPPALAGIEQKQGFSGEDLKEAYFVFNAITQNGRDLIEKAVNRVLKHSKFETKEIKIKKLTLDLDEKKIEGEEIENKKS